MTRTMRKLAVGIVAILLAAVSAALLTASPSQADPKKLLVSNSAEGPFKDNLVEPLFGELGPLVPQDAEGATFYVKNNSAQPARATLVVTSPTKNAFVDALRFTYSVGGIESTTVPTSKSDDPRCKTFVTGPSIQPRSSQPVEVTVNFADVENQVAQNLQAQVDLVVTLSQVGPKGKVDVCGVQATAEPYTECKAANTTVVTLIGRQTCPVVKGVEGFAGRTGTTGIGIGTGSGTGSDAGTEVLGATGAARSLGTVLLVGFAALVTGAGLIAVRRRPDED